MLYWLITGILFGSDNLIKKKREEKSEKYDLLHGNVHIMTYHNYGACLNLLEKYPFVVKFISVFFTCFITSIFLLSLGKCGKGILKTGLAFLLGGAFSNTYDRMKKGYVVDYINFPKAPGKLKQVVFNLSDFAILIGALLIAFQGE